MLEPVVKSSSEANQQRGSPNKHAFNPLNKPVVLGAISCSLHEMKQVFVDFLEVNGNPLHQMEPSHHQHADAHEEDRSIGDLLDEVAGHVPCNAAYADFRSHAQPERHLLVQLCLIVALLRLISFVMNKLTSLTFSAIA